MRKSTTAPATSTNSARSKRFVLALALLVPFILALTVSSSCTDPSSAEETDTVRVLTPDITIPAQARTFWFLDSTLEQFIYPPTFDCVPGEPCAIISTGSWDYTCTQFPDTFWGLVQYDYAPSSMSDDTLYCFDDTCRVYGDTTRYPMQPYFDRMANALCTDCARAYTRYGFCYLLSEGEDTVCVYNTCFDTTLTAGDSLCLPKLPIDSLNGIYIASTDTLFCPTVLINSWDGYFDRETILSWHNNH